MRTHIFHPWVAAAALGTASTLGACTGAEDDPDLPRVTVSQRVLLGDGDCGDVASGTLMLTNHGDHDARFALRSPDLHLLLAPARGTIAPGETIAIAVTALVPRDARPGQTLSAPVAVAIDDDHVSTVPVSFEARGAAIELDPPLLGIGQVPVGERIVRGFTVRNTGNAPASVAIRNAGDEIDVQWKARKLAPGDAVDGEVRYLPVDLGLDQRAADVTVAGATCGPPPGKLVIAGEGVPGAGLLVQGGPVDFGAVRCDEPTDARRITLVNRADLAVTWAATFLPDGGTERPFTVTPDRGAVPANGSAVIEIARRDGAATWPGAREAVLRVGSWAGAEIRHDLTVRETILGAALRVETTSDFGAVPVGEIATQPLTIVNAGNVGTPLEIAAAGYFTVEVPGWIDAGGKITGEVRFAPKTPGWHGETLTVTATGACAPPVIVTYKGEGLAPE